MISTDRRTATVLAVNVSKSFGDTKALRDCSFTATEGEIHAIVGENGSGKSTLAKIISGVIGQDSGELTVLGGHPRSPRAARARGVATVFQETLLADNASVVDNVYLGLDGLARKIASKKQRLQRTAELLHRLTGETIDPTGPVADLPLSVKQWIVIARALIREPQLLILDESSAALDLTGAARLHNEMKAVKGQGVTVLMVTHRIAELTLFADRATVLRDGQDVGILEGEQITEARLIKLMTGDADAHAAHAAHAAHTAATVTPAPVNPTPALSVTEATLQGGASFDFTANVGEIVGLAGLDGQGQGEFARALAGFFPLSTGSVTVHPPTGAPVPITGPAAAAAAGIQYVSGDRKKDGIFPNMSILENFAAPLYRRHSRASIVDFRSVRALFTEQEKSLSIKTGNSSNMIGTLSGGHQQKVLIGRSLAAQPRIVVFNDPARGVDIRTKKELYAYLRALADTGCTVVYVSTELEEFIGFCHRVGVFRGGRLAEWVSGDDLTADRVLAAMFGYRDTTPIVEARPSRQLPSREPSRRARSEGKPDEHSHRHRHFSA